MSTFSNLSIGDIFEFDHQGVTYLSIPRGPWLKTGHTTYIYWADPEDATPNRIGKSSTPTRCLQSIRATDGTLSGAKSTWMAHSSRQYDQGKHWSQI